MARLLLHVSFACNDDRGNFAGRIEEVSIEKVELHLEGPSIVYREEDRRLLVGRRRFDHLGTTVWVGNWCWNGAYMHSAEARRLVKYLIERGWKARTGPADGPWAKLIEGAW